MPNLAGFPPQGSGGGGDPTGYSESAGTVTIVDELNVGSATNAVATGDLAAGDGTRALSYDASGNRLTVVAPGGVSSQLYLQQGGNNALILEGTNGTGALLRLFNNSSQEFFRVDPTEVELNSATALKWSSTTTASGTKDVGIERNTAGALQITDGSTGGGALNVGNLTAAGANGDLAAGDGTGNNIRWDASATTFQLNRNGDGRIDFDVTNSYMEIRETSGNAPSVRLDAVLGRGLALGQQQVVEWNSTDSASFSGDLALARSAAGVLLVTDGSTGTGALLSEVLVEANTAGSGAPNVITATETGTVYTNEGATAENHHDLPTAAAGLTYTFVVQDADGIQVNAATGDTIRIAGSVSATGGLCESTTIGDTVTLCAVNATEWIAVASHGTWTVT